MELKELRPNEQEKYRIAKEVVDLGCTDTAIRRGRTKLGCTRKTLLKYTTWYQIGDLTLFSHRNKGRQPATTVPQETREMVQRLYRETYSDANFTHFMEILKQTMDCPSPMGQSIRFSNRHTLSPPAQRRRPGGRWRKS